MAAILGRLSRAQCRLALKSVGLRSYWRDGKTEIVSASRTLRRINIGSQDPLHDISSLLEQIQSDRSLHCIADDLRALLNGAGIDLPPVGSGQHLEAVPREYRGARGQIWRIKNRIGEGGQAKVYRAWDDTLCMLGALKVIQPHKLRDTDARQRFEREGRILRRLNHACILKLLDYGDDPLPFIVSPLAPMGTLEDCMAIFRRDLWRTLRMARDVAIGLAAAHSFCLSDEDDEDDDPVLIHRDVKPSNVFLFSLDHAVIGDFGIALDPTQTRISATDVRVGTAMYAAPESSYDATRAYDIFSLGATLHEVLQRQECLTPEQCNASYSIKPYQPLVAQYNDSRFEKVDELLRAMLCRERSERIQTMSEVIDGLDRLIQLFFGHP